MRCNLNTMEENKSLKIHMEMGMLLSMAYRSMTRSFVHKTQESGLDISLDQWMVLGPVWQLKNPSHKDLSEFCMKDKTSITRIVDMLEKKNLVVRVNDQLDQRMKRVVLTNEGKQLFNHVVPIMEKTRKEVKFGISDEDIETFKKVLIMINQNMDSNNG